MQLNKKSAKRLTYPISCILGLRISIEMVLSDTSVVSSPDRDLLKKKRKCEIETKSFEKYSFNYLLCLAKALLIFGTIIVNGAVSFSREPEENIDCVNVRIL